MEILYWRVYESLRCKSLSVYDFPYISEFTQSKWFDIYDGMFYLFANWLIPGALISTFNIKSVLVLRERYGTIWVKVRAVLIYYIYVV